MSVGKQTRLGVNSKQTQTIDARQYGVERYSGRTGDLMDAETGTMSPAFQAWAEQTLTPAVAALQTGMPVAFPTETVYGLGADISCPAAVAQIYELKGRPDDNPLIVHVACRRDIAPLAAAFSPQADALANAFMPGPLTLVLPRSAVVPDVVTAGLDTVGIRIPLSLPARAFIALSGRSVAAPSANLSGSPSPTEAAHVVADFQGRLSYVIDGGPAAVGLESTVLDVSGPVPLILRPGQVTAADVIACLLAAGVEPAEENWREVLLASEKKHSNLIESDETPRAPGMKYRHYAPSVPVEIIPLAAVPERTAKLTEHFRSLQADAAGITGRPLKLGLFAGRALVTAVSSNESIIPFCYGDQDDQEQAARALFAGLRSLDRSGVDLILAEAMPLTGVGIAYMNRLEKAAAGGDLQKKMK